MASLLNKAIGVTYKDLLTVLGDTQGEGLEATRKQVFDGEGVGSPLYLGTNSLEVVGSTTITGTLSVTSNIVSSADITATNVNGGTLNSESYKFGPNASSSVEGFVWNNTRSAIEVRQDLITKGKMTFSKTNYDDLVISAETGTLEKGDGSKGKVSLGDTKVSLKKGDTELLSVEEDGTLRMQSVSSEPSSPSSGDMVNIDGKLYINQ